MREEQTADDPTKFADTGARHLAGLDSLRGIAALSVVFFHVNWINITEPLSYVRNSYLMVDLFFVLSGFVIFYAYGEKLRNAKDAGRFMWLRFWRIYPVHFVLLIVFLLIEIAKYFAQLKFGIAANHRAFSENNGYAFIANLLLIQSLHVFPYLTFNTQAWSISTEFYTYVLFALAAWRLPGRKGLLTGSALVTILGAGFLVWLGRKGGDRTYDFGMVRCLTGFSLGILTCALYQAIRARPVARTLQAPAGWIALAIMAGFIAFLSLKTYGYSDLGIYPLSALLILFVGLAPASGPTGFLFSKPLKWLGAVSYSLYMVHTAVLWVVEQAIRFGTHARQIVLPHHETPVLLPSPTVGLAALLASVLLVLAAAQFCYAWIEKPFREWSRAAWKARPSRDMAAQKS
jgi:peptidoglycan/LPS O-acetylase OafA/YrhL